MQKDELPNNNGQQIAKTEKQSFKTKLCFFFGYNGQQFQGMQFQRQHGNTIQNTLHKVLVQKGFILKTNATELKRIKWSRAARTDKRVHALCNAVSFKIQIYPQYLVNDSQDKRKINFNKIILDVNDELPMDIRLFAIKKVGKNFDVRVQTFTRVYNYIIPSKMFQPYKQFRSGKKITGQDLTVVLSKINQLVQNYIGTHNFHNFTRGYKRSNPRCQRYMISMKAQHVQKQTILAYIEKQQQKPQYEDFIRFTLVGQSFIYHQIRKMVGMIVKVFSEELLEKGNQQISKALKEEGYQTYLTPGQGLYLNRMTFEPYNKKPDIEVKLQFNEEQSERIIKYRSYLEEKILDHQMRQHVFSDWLINKFQNLHEEKGQSEEQKSVNNQ